ncbi:DUF4860 domain-containing protein [Sedimentibacter saalensis]|uniref:Uncharacterized protein DUF4860 n=1 Tax=Sedimentibacter saalensis TaxID=130788 RepID=A0A562J0R1_9FIRM|nr:DUF4860 domain-containing protein [Sedimentibacter saalensis]TWH76385.1 uncharacterized protein DUF4860 [Sedimentibacter saalensis]
MNSKNFSKQFSFQFVFIMLLFLIIVILSVMIIVLGKNIYVNINEDRDSNYELRVSLSYIANKIRQSDKQGTVEIRNYENNNAVVINETYDDENYETWIYFYDNAIYEMFTDENATFLPEEGMKIVDCDSLEITKIKDNLYKFAVSSSAESSELVLNLYSNN